MSKTISREFWVSDKDFGKIQIPGMFTTIENGLFQSSGIIASNKITIMMEIPDRKIEITESELNHVLENINYHYFDRSPEKLALHIKEKILRKSED